MGGATNTTTAKMEEICMELLREMSLKTKGINKDIAMSIFSKLSIKDLVRFKCVSKHWDRIISDPILAKLYINPKSTDNTFLILDLQNREAKVSWVSWVRPDFSPDSRYLYKAVTSSDRIVPLPDEIGPNDRVLGYVDGLICFSRESGDIFLCNLSTREHRSLTLPGGCSSRRALPSKGSGVGGDEGISGIADKKELGGSCSSGRARRARTGKRSGGNKDKGKLEIADKKEEMPYECPSRRARPSKRSGVNVDMSRLEIADKKNPLGDWGNEDMYRLEIADKKEISGDRSGLSGRRRSYYLGGIGYDRRTCDYKVVVISFESNKSTENNRVMVFPLRENSWREVRGDFPYSLGCNDTHRVPVNGSIHWLVYDQNRARAIVSFDLSTEEIGEIPFPDRPEYVADATEPHCRVDLGALEGQLALILHNQYDKRREFYMHLWVMEEYGDVSSWRQVGWRTAFHNAYDDEMHLSRQISCWDGPMFLTKNGQVWVGDALDRSRWHSGLRKEDDHKDFIATPMGFRNTMIEFLASPVSPFGTGH